MIGNQDKETMAHFNQEYFRKNHKRMRDQHLGVMQKRNGQAQCLQVLYRNNPIGGNLVREMQVQRACLAKHV